MARPIEESIYDPTLTKAEKFDLLLRHWSREGKRVTEPDELYHAVMSGGMTDMEAAKYWSVEGGSRRWALYHAEAVLRSDPNSLEALTVRAQQQPRDRRIDREPAYLAILQRDPTHRKALAGLAGGTVWERPRGSMEYAKRYLDTYPESGGGYNRMGAAHERLGDLETARSYYEDGIKVAPNHFGLNMALRRLDSGEPMLPLETRQATTEPRDPPPARGAATTSEPTIETPPTPTRPPEGPPPRPPAPVSPGPPPETPKHVQAFGDSLDEYRTLADEFESLTGQPYQGLQDFDDYAEQSSNWMAWRYMELGRQYLEAGRPDEAAKVFEKAERQFPDDPLIQQRTKRSR